MISLFLLWFHQLGITLAVMFLPAIIVSIVLIRYADLEQLKRSLFGDYIRTAMTKSMEIVRFIGFAVAVLGAWHQSILFIFCGLLIILFGWLRGIFLAR